MRNVSVKDAPMANRVAPRKTRNALWEPSPVAFGAILSPSVERGIGASAVERASRTQVSSSSTSIGNAARSWWSSVNCRKSRTWIGDSRNQSVSAAFWDEVSSRSASSVIHSGADSFSVSVFMSDHLKQGFTRQGIAARDRAFHHTPRHPEPCGDFVVRQIFLRLKREGRAGQRRQSRQYGHQAATSKRSFRQLFRTWFACRDFQLLALKCGPLWLAQFEVMGHVGGDTKEIRLWVLHDFSPLKAQEPQIDLLADILDIAPDDPPLGKKAMQIHGIVPEPTRDARGDDAFRRRFPLL